MHDAPPEPEGYLTRAELARILGVSKDTIRRLEKLGLPRVVFGERSVRYRLSEVEAWQRSQGR